MCGQVRVILDIRCRVCLKMFNAQPVAFKTFLIPNFKAHYYHFYFLKVFNFWWPVKITDWPLILIILCFYCVLAIRTIIVNQYFVWKSNTSLFTFCYLYHTLWNFVLMIIISLVLIPLLPHHKNTCMPFLQEKWDIMCL
jgi:hypothetical protein